MAFVRWKEISDSTPVTIKENFGRDYERVFRVEFDAFNHSAAEAVLNLPVHRGDIYVSPNGLFSDPVSIAMTCNARREEEFSNHYIVTIGYSSKLWEDVAKAYASGGTGSTGNAPGAPSAPGSPGSGNQDSQSPLNPLNRPWKVSHGSTSIKRRLYRDRSSSPVAIANSAGDPFFYEEDVFVRVITITRNIPPPTISQQLAYEAFINTVNLADFLGRPAGTVKCVRIDGQTEFEEGVAFFAQTLEFHYKEPDEGYTNAQAWHLILMDNGTHEIGADGKRVTINDKLGTPVTDNVPLDGTGKKLSEANVLAGNFVYRDFEQYKTEDFSDLGFS